MRVFQRLCAEGNRSGDGAAFDRAAGKILGELAMPFTGLGCDGALGGRPFLCCATQIKTLV